MTMTTNRTYACNVCHDRIVASGDGLQGIGITFASNDSLTQRPVTTAETHVCLRCLGELRDIATRISLPTKKETT